MGKDIKEFDYFNFIQNQLYQEPFHDFFIADDNTFKIIKNPTIPYRNFFYGIGLVMGGEAELMIGASTYIVKKNTFIVIGPGVLRNWKKGYESIEQKVLFFNQELFKKDFGASIIYQFTFFEPGMINCFTIDDELRNKFLTLIQLIENSPKTMVPGLIYSTLKFIQIIYPAHTIKGSNTLNQPFYLSRQFQYLLNKHYLEFHNVSYYADQLNISAKHLSEVVKSETGKSPKSWIIDMTINEAKSLLLQTTLTIKQITHLLGYTSQSYFIKQFKSKTNYTPSEYRQHFQKKVL